MSGIRDIKRRISSVRNMRKITGAMHMVSSARLKGAQSRAQDFGDFFDKARDIMAKIPATLEHKEDRPPLFIVIAGDRGLAGGYNNLVLRTARREMDKAGDARLITIGQRARKFFINLGIEPALWYTGMEKQLSSEALEEVSRAAVEQYTSRGGVYAAYTYFRNPAVQQVKVVKLLPPERNAPEQQRPYIFEPSPEELIRQLTEFYVKMSIYGFYLHSYASEQAFRMKAMENATQNADDLLEELSLKFHRERKAIITREITEIVSGAENYLH